MPPRSEQQRKAMYAAAAGKSTLGIPKKVGAEFVKADKGGKLPARTTTGAETMSNAHWDAWDAHDEAYGQRAQDTAVTLNEHARNTLRKLPTRPVREMVKASKSGKGTLTYTPKKGSQK